MDKKYINANKLYCKIKNTYFGSALNLPWNYKWIALVRNTVDKILKLIKDFPASNVEEVKHGEWLFINRIGRREMWMCDQCERCIIVEDHEKRKIDLDRDYPYCHCGACMDGKEAEK